MNTINIHGITSVRLSPVQTLDIPASVGSAERKCYTRDLILIDDDGRKTCITIYAESTPEQLDLV